ncbi:MAG: glycosyltransferase family 39 protein [Planctomycetes bacterium]|nr:glycosyltransferase family 39 protein [Planctomycetota bacterium]MCP4770135.1 glycosyltransferase family 39 protein [Planctomycetota bacterium]MCP4860717.1 glycosyltransferase family 39 protein [Planctomycetota bacterium]
MIAFVLGSVPAFCASIWDEKAFQSWDLPIAAAVLMVGMLFVRFAKPMALAKFPWQWGYLIVIAPVLAVMLSLDGPITNDERASMLQAELMASGELSEPLIGTILPNSSPDLADAFRRRQVFEDVEAGVRFSKYAPGTALAMVPFTVVGSPLLATLVAGFLNLWLMLLVARRLGLRAPGFATLMLATSPFFLLVHTSMQSEVFTTPAILAGYLAYLKARDGNPKWALLLGLASGWVFLTRPLTGVLFALVAGILLLLDRNRMKTVPMAVVGGLPTLALALWWNHHFTGSWTTSVYELYASTFGPFFPGPERLPQDVYGNGDFIAGMMRQGGRWAVAFGGMLGAIGLGFWGAWRLRARDGGLAIAFSIVLPLAYALHWYAGHRAYLGPLYLFESLAMLLLGAMFLLEQAPKAWRRGILLVMVSAGGAVFLPRWGLVVEESTLRSAPQTAVVENLDSDSNSVIFLPKKFQGSKEKGFKYWTPSRPTSIAGGGPVILRTTGRLTPQCLIQELGLQGRELYRFIPGESSEDPGKLESWQPASTQVNPPR